MKNSKKTPRWKTVLHSSTRRLVLQGEYKGALEFAKIAREHHPTDPDCLYLYAKLLGDWADELPPREKKKKKAEAIAILKPLLRKLAGESIELRFGAGLNYYYQSENFRGMHRFGQSFERIEKKKGVYAQGVGASLYAAELRQKGSYALAKRWALKALDAWKKYPLKSERYYFAHYVQALAFAVSEQPEAALKSLTSAAKLAKKDLSDWEFADVIALIESTH